jgi:hypothetical protein
VYRSAAGGYGVDPVGGGAVGGVFDMNVQRELIEHWQKRDEEKGYGKLPSAEYRRHAKVFTFLIARCNHDVDVAKRAIDAFFDDDSPYRKRSGWAIGQFQADYQGYITKVKEADERAVKNARRWQEQKVETEERTMQAPTPPPEVGPKLAALKARLFGKVGGG